VAVAFRAFKQRVEDRAGLPGAFASDESLPIYQRLGKAFRMLLGRHGILPKSALGIALRYTLGLWARLGVYLGHGKVEIDNNAVENAIRPSAVGKKNWLFIGREDSGWKSAVFYTLIANCRLHGIDPHTWFKDVLERLPATTNHNLGELLPVNLNRQGQPKWVAAS
jgi:transposase